MSKQQQPAWRSVASLGEMLAFLKGKTIEATEEYRPHWEGKKAGRALPSYGDEAGLVVCTDGSAICCVIHDAEPGYSEYTPGSDMSVEYFVADEMPKLEADS